MGAPDSPIYCWDCRHFLESEYDAHSCAAFPDGIPDAIIDGEFDHTQPYPGDNGIRFEELADTEP